VKSKANFFYGKFNGLYSEYYENGNKKEEITFLNGSRHGISTYYAITGKQTLKYFYYDDSAYKTLK
jgi:antitoxin component YwqK of YwqJK toxin-antitoxin module